MSMGDARNGRDGVTPEEIKQEFHENLMLLQGADLTMASPNDCYLALAYTVRQFLIQRWLDTQHAHTLTHAKEVYYLSAEYLLGQQLGHLILNAGMEEAVGQAVAELGLDFATLAAQESEPGLGNGGLGRLAACYLDSLATLGIPATGYGIRYDYGIFRQAIVDGWQVEQPDAWLTNGAPWSFPRPELAVEVGMGGRTEMYTDEAGHWRARWTPDWRLLGVPHNMMVPGYRSGTVNTLRLWSARAARSFDLQIFNTGDYIRAVEQQTLAENLSKILYPDDSTPQGRQLRLQQQYFFVACSLADILRAFVASGEPWERLPDRAVIQLNDTHPTIGIAELMRLLVDEQALAWDDAWAITSRVFAYTCHTLLPEALETWPVALFERLLPRHLAIIYEINRRFLDEVQARFPGDEERVRRMSIVGDGGERRIRMAHLAAVGSFAINGVAVLHSALLRDRVLRDFADLWPEKFVNVTNGVTPRRFVRLANPHLSSLISRTIGPDWPNDLDQLRRLEPHAESPQFRATWRAIKGENKERLAAIIAARLGIAVAPDALFDVMVKRLHEYKRQLLKVLHVVALHQRLRANPADAAPPRVVIFGAKAAPGYWMAKQIIKLINNVAEVVNADPLVGDRLKVVFLPNFNVTLAERVYPAADLSEQISLAGKEASGTGNMKFALNGAVTIGTLDGANIEIRDLVGPENFFLFGLTEAEVTATRTSGHYPAAYYRGNPTLAAVLDGIAGGDYSGGDTQLFRPIIDSLLGRDEYLTLTDFQPYLDAQDAVERAYRDREGWTRMSILNAARCGFFSSDRSIRDYCDLIWQATPVGVGG